MPQEPRAVLPSSWTVTPRKEAKEEEEEPDEPRTVLPGSWTFVSRKPQAEEKVPPPEVRLVLPRGSAIKDNLTRQAAPDHRSIDSTSRGDSIRGDTNSNFYDGRGLTTAVALHAGRTGSSFRGSSAASDRLSDRPAAKIPLALSKAWTIKSITQDMDALNRSCCAEAAVGSEPVGSLEPAVKDKKLAHPAPQSNLTKKEAGSPVAFSSRSHRRTSRQRVGQAPVEKQ